MRKILFTILALSLGMGAYAQDLHKNLEKAYSKIVKDKNLMLQVDIDAWELGKKEKIIDSNRMTYINDGQSVYMHSFGNESIQKGKQSVRINHDIKEIYLMDASTERPSSEQFNFPDLINSLEQIEKQFRVEKSKVEEFDVYKLYHKEERGALIMEIKFDGDKLVESTQYPPQNIPYRGKTIKTVVNMKYSYSNAEQTKNIDEVLDIPSLKAKGKLKEYSVRDFRSKK